MSHYVGEVEYSVLYKVVIVGDAGVGKTNMLAYYKDGSPVTPTTLKDRDLSAKSFEMNRKPTIGVEFHPKIFTHPNGTVIKAQIWDTAGQERYRAITSSHYRRASGAVLVYDVSDKKSFENAKNLWLKELREQADEQNFCSVMLVGNKVDLVDDAEDTSNFVNPEEHAAAARELCDGLGMRSSAKTGLNIHAAFEDLITRIHNISEEREKERDAKEIQQERVRLAAATQEQAKSDCAC